MPLIILDGRVAESDFDIVSGDDVDTSQSNVLIPMKVWLENRDTLAGRNDIGIWLEPDDEVEDIADAVLSFPIIGLNFPTFFDGRCLSTATLLRRQYGFDGELRAVGDVRRDQIEQMKRCGINAFDMADGQDLDKAIESLHQFSHAYQATVDNPEPLFRKR